MEVTLHVAGQLTDKVLGLGKRAKICFGCVATEHGVLINWFIVCYKSSQVVQEMLSLFLVSIQPLTQCQQLNYRCKIDSTLKLRQTRIPMNSAQQQRCFNARKNCSIILLSRRRTLNRFNPVPLQVAAQEAGKRRRPLHPSVRSLTTDLLAFNYSTQALNSTELGKDVLRSMLAEKDSNAR